jgi:D-glycero-alpha-D-manno-heptose-7-phosphate kinase
MIFIKTPLRISFFGGGTDHPVWFKENGGAVLSTTIDKYIYLQMRRIYQIFDYNYSVVWSKLEKVKQLQDIEHPVVREVLKKYWSNQRGLEFIYNADLPSRSGLGSSSSFTVAMLQGLWAELGKIASKYELASLAIDVEQNLLNEPVGCQDQVAVAYGGFNRINFSHDKTFEVNVLPMTNQRRFELESSMMLFFTGFTRDAGDIEKDKMTDLIKKTRSLYRIQGMVPDAEKILLDDSYDLSLFGELLDEGWSLKRGLSNKVSNLRIDDIYQAAKESGAKGGKLLGAGGGGFLLFFVNPKDKQSVRNRLTGVTEVPIRFESEGSKITIFEPYQETDNGRFSNL